VDYVPFMIRTLETQWDGVSLIYVGFDSNLTLSFFYFYPENKYNTFATLRCTYIFSKICNWINTMFLIVTNCIVHAMNVSETGINKTPT